MVSKRSLILGLGALGVVAALGTAGVVSAQTPAPTPPAAQGWGPGYGCPWGGPGMQQGWGGGPGMQQGWGGGPGMHRGWGGGPGMQQGWGGGPGMQQGWGPGPWGGPAMQQGWGPGGQGGPGMMQGRGPRHAMMGGRGGGRGAAAALAADGDVTTDEVQKLMELRLARHNNPNLKIGKIEAKDDSVIVAEIVTKDGSLVRQFEVNRKTGQMRPVQ